MNWRRHTGLAVRAMVRGDLMAIGFMMFTLLIVALAIDLTKWLEPLRAHAVTKNVPLYDVLLPYLSYRGIDIVTRLLTMACLAGGFVITLLRHQRMDDIVLAAGGAGPSLRIAALVITGGLLGVVQMAGENWLRPAAVQRQMAAQLGDYGARFGDTQLGVQWLVDGNRALRANVIRGPDGHLSNVMVFEGLNQPTLTRILHAQSARPAPETSQWILSDVAIWQPAASADGQHQTTHLLTFPLHLNQVQWYGIDGYYLPNTAARQIANLPDTAAAPDAATALAVRKVALVLPGIFALLGVSLASMGTQGRRLAPFKLLALAAVGYLLVVSVKVFWALGIHAIVTPVAAATVPAAAALLLAVLLQLQQSGHLPSFRSRKTRDRQRLRSQDTG